MALMLGIDTGGTFTDAVLVDEARSPGQVVAHAKAPTTHHDLTVGVGAAIAQVLGQIGTARAAEIALVSVSTTLATNALVEGHGEPAALVTFGFSQRELERTGIERAVDADHLVRLDGGHDAHGNETTPLDEEAIERAATDLASRVSAFAVASQFSVRNPSHERRAAELIRTTTGRPVTASHELSAKLDGPRRALTAALNARLLSTVDRLNRAVSSVLQAQSIQAPIMVVRGDGSLVSAAFASERPIETVLSGPAASVIGALHLAGLSDGLVADVGGTTTDVAVISAGRPSITDGGAIVGDHRTMVEAVDMATIGLGGDSEVRIDPRDRHGPVLLGPERAIPLCRLAVDYPNVHDTLDRQLAAPMGLTSHGRFLVSVAPAEVVLSDGREIEVLSRLSDGPIAYSDAAPSGLADRAAGRLRARGLVRIATMTPTDASAMTGAVPGVDADAATKVAALLARQTGANGAPVAVNGEALAAHVVDLLVDKSAAFLIRVALHTDGIDATDNESLLTASLRGHRGAASVSIGLAEPVTAIGAPAGSYYDRVAAQVATTAVVPDYFQVANAIGAVVGRVRVRQSATITQPTRGQFRVHLDDQPTFGSVENARTHATEVLEVRARSQAEAAGAATPEIAAHWEERTATVDGREIFVEGLLTIEASGRPRF